jgi:hypothetical protein
MSLWPAWARSHWKESGKEGRIGTLIARIILTQDELIFIFIIGIGIFLRDLPWGYFIPEIQVTTF